MRPLILGLGLASALAGCETTETQPVTGVLPLAENGLVSLTLDGAVQSFVAMDGGTAGVVQGNLYSTAETLTLASGGTMPAWSANGLSLDGAGALSLAANWNAADTFDITRPAAIESLRLDTGALVGGDGTVLTLGPQGGSLTVREIVPEAEGRWRIRGNYSAQGCADGNPGDCRSLTGTFALTQSDLPTNGNVAALLGG